MKTLEDLRSLSDEDIALGLEDLICLDRQTNAGIVGHLVVVLERSMHLDRGYASLIEYLVEGLGCSKDMAFKRSAAAQVARHHPVVLSWIDAGEMTLSGLATLAGHKEDEELVLSSRGKSKRQIAELIASKYPDSRLPRGSSRTRPVAEGVCRLEVTLPNEVLAQIEEALDLDSHLDPSRDVAGLLARAMESYLAGRKKEKFAQVQAPQKARTLETQSVPAKVRREAYERSGGQCEFRSEDGRRCSAKAFLELDHVIPRAHGGGHDQVRILCREHNQRAAELALGERAMAEARQSAQSERDVASALRKLGYSAKVSRQAGADAVREEGPDGQLEDYIRRALQRTGGYASQVREDGRPWMYENTIDFSREAEM